MAAEAEYHKTTKYQELGSVYLFVHLAIETSGAFGSMAADLFLLIWKNGSHPSWRNPGYSYRIARLKITKIKGHECVPYNRSIVHILYVYIEITPSNS